MVKVITYGTYDLLHYGHIRLLERAKALGDYLIVGITSDDYDKTRGKINNQQSLMERIAAVKETGIADEIIVEEYEGQKIDDIKKYGVDIFTVGSDWVGHFDYLSEYCKVVYLPRTEGVSSSEIREKKRSISIGIAGVNKYLNKVIKECGFVNGIKLGAICTDRDNSRIKLDGLDTLITEDYEQFLDAVDCVYLHTNPAEHYAQIKRAIERGKHVLCESPLALSSGQCDELYALAAQRGLILMDALRTAYSTAYLRLRVLVKTGIIGDIVSVDTVCTNLSGNDDKRISRWSSITGWGPTALLPIFQILGTEYTSCRIVSRIAEHAPLRDAFSNVSFVYGGAVASAKVGTGVKSEGEMIISGTKGYVFVPSPWWKTDYFEVRFENPAENKRYFYQLDGEGIRNELVAFLKAISEGSFKYSNIDETTSRAVCDVIEQFYRGDITEI